MSDAASLLPWVINFLEFVIMAGLVWRIVGVLDDALSRAQGIAIAVAPVPAPFPAPAPGPVEPPVIPTSAPSKVVDPALVAFVKKFEGFSAKAYWDYKQWSIGYGTKATSSTEVITEAEALKRLTEEVSKAEVAVEKVAANAPVGVKQALTDLTYNAGEGWEKQTLGTLIKEGKYEEAKSHVLAYNHAGGQVNAGLTARREAEVKMFDQPI
jgi:GH24 family phage-related lysozyme (muramidase)